jgi:hypothetical protein
MMVTLICPDNVALQNKGKGKYSGEYFPLCFVEQTTKKRHLLKAIKR